MSSSSDEQCSVSSAATDFESECVGCALIVSEHLRQILMMSGRLTGALCPV